MFQAYRSRPALRKKISLSFLVVANKRVITLRYAEEIFEVGHFCWNWVPASFLCPSVFRGERLNVQTCMQKICAYNIDELNVVEALRQCASCAVIIVAKNKISLLTSEAAELIGITSEKALGKKIEVLPDAFQKIFEQVFSIGQPVVAHLNLQHPTRGEINVQINASPVQNDGEKISSVVAVLSDFSSVQKLGEKMERIDKLASIGTLSASMAHEIKNALVAIRTFTDLLISRNPEDELAEIVGREMKRIDSIVSQMLTFSGPAKPVLMPIHVHDLLNHSLKLVEHQLGQKNIKLQRAFGATPDIVKGDDYQLKQAFLNLLLNALEAMPANGNLTITTEMTDAEPEIVEALREKDPAKLRVTIQDSGSGIKPENLAKIFEPFFTTKPKGTGLGLSITRRIVNEHRASISVESQPDQGAAFSIVFPIFRKGY